MEMGKNPGDTRSRRKQKREKKEGWERVEDEEW